MVADDSLSRVQMMLVVELDGEDDDEDGGYLNGEDAVGDVAVAVDDVVDGDDDDDGEIVDVVVVVVDGVMMDDVDVRGEVVVMELRGKSKKVEIMMNN